LLRSYYFSLILLLVSADVLAAPQKSDQPAKDSDVVYAVGGDVKPPKIIHYVEPAASDSSQDAYVEGLVRISAVVNLDGAPAELQVLKGLNADEDKLAVAALKQWRFQPGTRKGQAVRVRITVEIEFHLL
jgi:TonB family protein